MHHVPTNIGRVLLGVSPPTLQELPEQTILFSCHGCCLHINFCTSFDIFRYDTQAFLPKNVNLARYMATRRASKCFQEVGSVLEDPNAVPSTAKMAETASAATDGVSAVAAVNGAVCRSSSTLYAYWKYLRA